MLIMPKNRDLMSRSIKRHWQNKKLDKTCLQRRGLRLLPNLRKIFRQLKKLLKELKRLLKRGKKKRKSYKSKRKYWKKN